MEEETNHGKRFKYGKAVGQGECPGGGIGGAERARWSCKGTRAAGPGSLGALLRREGLYHSNLATWRRQRNAGTLEALEPRKRGPKAKEPDPLVIEMGRLRQENERLQKRLKQAELIIDAQKKISQILGITLETQVQSGKD